MATLIIGTVDFGQYAPPRSEMNRSTRRVVRTEGAYNLDGIYTDFGNASDFLHVFQSEGNLGFLTTAQVRALEALEDEGGTFQIQTDHFGVLDDVQTYTARFDTTPPVYRPVAYRGEMWQFSIPLRINR